MEILSNCTEELNQRVAVEKFSSGLIINAAMGRSCQPVDTGELVAAVTVVTMLLLKYAKMVWWGKFTSDALRTMC